VGLLRLAVTIVAIAPRFATSLRRTTRPVPRSTSTSSHSAHPCSTCTVRSSTSSTTSRTGNEEAEANTNEDGVVSYCDPEKTNFEFDEGIGECPLRFEPADADDDGEIDGCSPRTTTTLPPTTTTGDPATTTTTTTTSSPTTTTTQPPP